MSHEPVLDTTTRKENMARSLQNTGENAGAISCVTLRSLASNDSPHREVTEMPEIGSHYI